MYSPKNIVIIGGNAAGPAAAAKAKRVNPDSNVILFEAGRFISTGTCELPYALSGEISDAMKLVFFDSESFEQKGVKVYVDHLVEKIDRRRKTVTVLNKASNQKIEYPYDRLILTTGSKPVYIPKFDKSLDNLFTLKSVSDLIKLDKFLSNNSQIRNVAVIGAGYIGLETAEAFRKKGFAVKLFERENLPLPNSGVEIGNIIAEILKENNIEFYGQAVDIEPVIKDNTVKAIKHQGWTIEVDMVLLAAGVKPNNNLAAAAGLTLGEFGGLKVDSRCKTSDPNIFAAGDNIEVKNSITNRYDYIPLATIARDYGHIAGENAAGGNAIARGIVPNVALKLFDYYIATVGINRAKARKYNLNVESVYATAPNLVKVMPGSRNGFGKILFDKYTGNIFGAQFIGGKEVAGHADIVSVFINNKIPVYKLSDIDYNYTPPLSPFINILSILGRKAKEVKK
ncbi:FAD-dependent pyridine nucleotide-disulfide oxidoreductase [Melioribacter roseus P3M-2]|uniref:FAD-dependent pyridine nucleotide-disulfide oxidoreductase n=1 Tax=Melioribacter roseus (strain DSM 23840 / JCM 17771 / VKM B-2668 / P3M-2) TaxID=1191523 RepID=I7A5G1_MELRP|nr:FAD-dependent oxidoreductase [Melioribacter roseus]AFN75126.1 FAD-dependent pyridine nucleotide-disulfide oxidoreductase [Melioribacter roseus P3M-2]